MRSLGLLAMLVGCGPSAAIEVVVEMPPQASIDHVQLYVGLGGAANESGHPEVLIPRDFGYPDVPEGLYWRRDPFGTEDVVDVSPGATDVRFVFQEGTDDRMTAIIVGYRAGEVVAAAALVDAVLERGSVRQYHVALKPASAALPRPTSAAVTVHRWGPTPGDTRCAYFEDPMSMGERSLFIVDDNDRDCDGFSDDDPLECRAKVHLGKERPKRDDTTCVTPDMIPTGTEPSACVLGGEGCIDGRGEVDGPCDPSTTCVQPAVCAGCAGRADGLTCMAKLAQQNVATTRIECNLFVDLAPNKLCPGAAVLSQRLAFLPMCDPDEHYLMWSQDKWRSQSITEQGVTLTAAKQNPACDFRLEASGMPTTLVPIFSLLSAQFVNGRSVAVPLRIDFPTATGCGLIDNECHLVGDVLPAPSLVACLGSRVVEPW